MVRIQKQRREWFGGIVFSENPACVLYVNEPYADSLGLEPNPRLKPGLLSAPLDVHISLTEKCGQQCPECYQRRGATTEMSVSRATEILRHLSSLGVFTVAFGGGEPFLHPGLFEIAAFARSVGIVPNVTTRGNEITDTVAARCTVFGNIHLSCNSVGDLPGLEAVLQRLHKHNIEAGLNLLATRRSFPEFPAIFRWSGKHKVPRILVLKYKTTEHNAARSPDFRLSREQESQLYPTLCRLSRKHGIVPMIDCSLFPALAVHHPSPSEVEFADISGCQGANTFIAVTTAGTYKPCSFWPETCGNILELSPEEWTTNSRLNSFRAARRELCGGCAFGETCRSACRLESHSLCEPPPGKRSFSL